MAANCVYADFECDDCGACGKPSSVPEIPIKEEPKKEEVKK